MLTEKLNTPLEVELDGTTYKMTRLSNAEMREVEDHIRSRRLRLLNQWRKAREIEPLEYRWQLAHLLDARETFTVLDDVTMLTSGEGMVFAIWLSIRTHHPEMTLKMIEEKLPIHEAMEIVNAMNRFTAEPDEAPEEEVSLSETGVAEDSESKTESGSSP